MSADIGTKRLLKLCALILLISIISLHLLNVGDSSQILDNEIAREMNKGKYIPSQERIEVKKQHIEELRKVYPDISMADLQLSAVDKLLAYIGIFGMLGPGECMQGVYIVKNGTVPDIGDFSASGAAAFGRAGGIEGAELEWFYRDSPEEGWIKFRESRTDENGFDAVILKKPGEYRVVAYYEGARGEIFWNITPDFMLKSDGISSSIIYMNVP